MSYPEAIRRYEQQAAWRDFATPLEIVGARPGWSVLDVGCGSGLATRLLTRQVAPGRVVGLDLDPEHGAAARALTPERDISQVAFVAGDARHLPFTDSAFDLLWSSFVVEYLAPVAVPVLREFARVVRPGGVVAVFEIDGLLLHHDPVDPDLAARIDRWHAWVSSRGFDPEIGQKLPDYFRVAGLRDMRAQTFPDPELYPVGRPSAGILDAWRRRLAGMGGIALALGSQAEAERFRQDILGLLQRPDRVTRGANWLVWGRV